MRFSAEADEARVGYSSVGLIFRKYIDSLHFASVYPDSLALWYPFRGPDPFEDPIGSNNLSIYYTENIAPLESLDDWSGTNLSLDSIDRTEGDYSIVESITSSNTASTITYNPAGVWNWQDNFYLFLDIKCDQPSSSFDVARVYIYDSEGHYRYWDLEFEANTWKTHRFFLSFMNQLGLGGQDNSSGFSGTHVLSCENTINWSTNLGVNLSVYESPKEGSFSVRLYAPASQLETDTDYYLRYTFQEDQDWSSYSYLYFFHGICTPQGKYNYYRFYIYDSDGDWAYWDLPITYARLRGKRIDLSSPDSEAPGTLDLSKVSYFQFLFNRNAVDHYEDTQVDWIRLDDLNPASIDKIEFVFKPSNTMSYTLKFDNMKVDSTISFEDGKYGICPEFFRHQRLISDTTTPHLDGSDFTWTLWFYPTKNMSDTSSMLLKKWWNIGLDPDGNVNIYIRDQNGGHGTSVSFAFQEKWYFVVLRCKKESSPDAFDGKVELLLFDENGLINSTSISNFGTPADSDPQKWFIGTEHWYCFNQDLYEGKIDDVRVYTKYLTDEELAIVRQGPTEMSTFKSSKTSVESLSLTDIAKKLATKPLYSLISFTSTLFNRTNKILLEALVFSSFIKRKIISKIKELLSFIESRSLGLQESFQESLNFLSLFFFSFLLTKKETLSLSEVSSRSLFSLRTEVLNLLDLLSSFFAREFTEDIIFTDMKKIRFALKKLESLGLVESMKKGYLVLRMEILNLSEIIKKLTSRLYEEVLVFCERIFKSSSFLLQEISNLVDILAFRTEKELNEIINFLEMKYFKSALSLFETFSLQDLFLRIFSSYRTFLETMTFLEKKEFKFVKRMKENLSFIYSITRKVSKLIFESVSLIEKFFFSFFIEFLETFYLSEFFKKTVKYLRTYQENLSLSDLMSRINAFIRTLLESFIFSELFTRTGNFLRIFLESLTFTEFRSFNLRKILDEIQVLCDKLIKKFYRTFLEPLTLSSQIIFSSLLKLFENLSLSDVYSRIVSYVRKLVENLNLVELFLRTIQFLRGFSENIYLIDTFSRTISFIRTFFEEVTISDTFLKIVQYLRTFYENFNLEDFLEIYKAFFRTLYESLYLTDLYSRTVSFSRTLGETLFLQDLFSRVVSYLRTKIEALALTEEFSRVINFVREFYETLTLQDFFQTVFHLLLTQILSLQEIFLRSFQVIRNFVETINLQDTFAFIQGFRRTLYETMFFLESLTKVTSFARIFYEISTLASEVSFSFTRRLKETLTLLEVLSKNILTRLAESIILVEILVKNILFKLYENLNLTELVSKVFKAIRNFVETLTLVGIETKKWKVYRVLSEFLVLTDLFSSLVSFLRKYTEILIAQDLLKKTFGTKLFQTLHFTDSFSRLFNALRTFLEEMTLIDTFSYRVGLVIELIETLTIVGIFNRLVQFERGFLEILSLQDFFQRTSIAFRTFKETLSLQDFYSRTFKAIRTFAEIFSLSEIIIRTTNFKRIYQEVISYSDKVFKEISLFLFRSLELLDSLKGKTSKFLYETMFLLEVISKDLSMSIKDVFVFCDRLLKEGGKKLTETLMSIESLIRNIGIFKTELLFFYETVIKGFSHILLETISVIDSFSRVFNGILTLLESVLLSEEIRISYFKLLSLFEELTLVDQLTRFSKFVRAFLQTLELKDSILTKANYLRSFKEILSLQEKLKRLFEKRIIQYFTLQTYLKKNIIKKTGEVISLIDKLTLIRPLVTYYYSVKVLLKKLYTNILLKKWEVKTEEEE